MSTQLLSELQKMELNIVGPQRPSNSDDKRFYHCTMDWEGMKCTPVSTFDAESNKSTKLLFVDKWIPESFDKYILRSKFTQLKAIILTK
jgi:hypothetical protein